MIHILADSMCDITQQEAAALNITVLPLMVRFGDEEYRDGVDMLPPAFYERLKTVTELPKTSQISPDRYCEAFDKLLERDEDEVLYICGSTKLSGTGQSAMLAKGMCHKGDRVTVLDSLSASPGTAMLVRVAQRLAAECEKASELVEKLISVRERTHLIGCAETLKYLVMGGRLNAAVGTVGSLLHIQPLLKLENGTMHQAGMCRSTKKALEWFCTQVKEHMPDPGFPIMVGGAGCAAARGDLRRALAASGLDDSSMMETEIGPVIGTYTGPGLTCVCWVARK